MPKPLASSIIRQTIAQQVTQWLTIKESQDPAEQMAHDLFVSQILGSYADKIEKAAKDDLMALKAERVDEIVKLTEADDAGGSYPFCQTPSYQVTINTRKPSTTIDKAALRVKLQLRFGLSGPEVDNFIDECSKKSAVPKGLKAEPLE